MNATILKFPYERINLDVKSGEAQIFRLPRPREDAVEAMVKAYEAWLKCFSWGL